MTNTTVARSKILAAGVRLLASASAVLLVSCTVPEVRTVAVELKPDPAEPTTAGAPAALRRLSQEQYRNSIADIFGADVRVPGRFEPEVRRDGLLAVGARTATVVPSGLEQYDLMARKIAAQVVDPQHRDTLLPCAPASLSEADATCTKQVITEVGRLLFRRPLNAPEIEARIQIAAEGTRQLGDYYSGLEYALSSLLVAPQFLFRDERVENDPFAPGTQRLDAYAKATRLSFLLWNTTPDDELLRAAERGELHSAPGLARQVQRLVGSPRLEVGVRAFFADMLGFDAFQELAKDPIIYPTFSARLANDIQEQTLRTIVDHVLVQRGDYRDLFTTRKTFINRTLGYFYRIPVLDPNEWQPYEMPADDPRAGLLTHPSFVSLAAHPGRSSATLRGKAVRELLMCQEVPAPPGNVDFKIVQDTANPEFKTARERLTAHSSEQMCAGCHKITDPIGLALETFDGAGYWRSQENGVAIDPSGVLDGTPFADAVGLGQAMRDNPQVTACLVNRVYAYGTGSIPQRGERTWLKYMTERFAQDSYRIPDLLSSTAMSQAFYRVAAPPKETRPATPTPTASAIEIPAAAGSDMSTVRR